MYICVHEHFFVTFLWFLFLNYFSFLSKPELNPRKNTPRRTIKDYLRHILMTDLVNNSYKEAQTPGRCSLQTLFLGTLQRIRIPWNSSHACSSVWLLAYMASLFMEDSMSAITIFIVQGLNKTSGSLAVLRRLQAWICILGTLKASCVEHLKSSAIFFHLICSISGWHCWFGSGSQFSILSGQNLNKTFCSI